MRRNHRFTPSEEFVCRHCRRAVAPAQYGSLHRNHCPWCLWSLHVDQQTPGDRRSACNAAMEPIGVWAKRDGEWSIIHRCTACGALRANRSAADDDPWAMISLAARPLSQPPFPLP